jgi:hypothetical protein
MIAWNTAFRGHYDSPWCMAQKLAWLNSTRVNEILATILGRSAPFKEGVYTRTFTDLQWLTGAPTRTDTRLTSSDSDQIAEVLTALAPHKVLSFIQVAWRLMSEDLRLCPSCILVGYHSVVHQLAGLERCPIHGDPLVEACRFCGVHFGQYNIRRSHGFACPRCGESLLADNHLPAFPAALKAAEKRRIAPILTWVRRIAPSIPCYGPSMVLATRRSDLYVLKSPEKALLPLMATISPFPLDRRLLTDPVPGLELEAKAAVSRKRSKRIAFNARDLIEHYVRTLETVMNEVLDSLGEHQTCWSGGAEVILGDDRHYLAFHSGVCVKAYAFALWKFRTRTFLKTLREFSQPTTPYMCLVIHDLRSRLLSEYCYCLHTADALHGLHVQGNNGCVRAALDRGALSSWPGPWLDIDDVLLPCEPGYSRPCPRLKFTSDGLGGDYYCDHGCAFKAHVRRLLAIPSVIKN